MSDKKEVKKPEPAKAPLRKPEQRPEQEQKPVQPAKPEHDGKAGDPQYR